MTDGLDYLKYEFARIGAALQSVESRVVALRQQVAPSNFDKTCALEKAKQYYKRRRAREQIFGTPDLFADPAWDILIDLFIAGEQGRYVSVSSACIASAVPDTTALRWINILESNRHILRQQDPNDGRRIFIALTQETAEKVRTYFSIEMAT